MVLIQDDAVNGVFWSQDGTKVMVSTQSFDCRVRVFVAAERVRDMLKELQDATVAAANEGTTYLSIYLSLIPICQPSSITQTRSIFDSDYGFFDNTT